MFSPTRDAPWAPGSETGKGQQHPEAIAMRALEGGNMVDEGEAFARDDCEANLALEGEYRVGENHVELECIHLTQKPVNWLSRHYLLPTKPSKCVHHCPNL